MIRRSNRSVSILGLAAGGLAAIVLAGGIWMLGSLNTAFKQLQRIHSIRIEAQGALALQADAVAGLAEFSATGNSAFDRSYLGESALSEGRLARLAPQLICCGQSAETALADARKKESIWKERAAGAIVAHPRDVLPAFDGTILMDQYRSDLYQIDEVLAVEEQNAASDVRHSIDAIAYVLAGFVIVSILGAACWRIMAVS